MKITLDMSISKLLDAFDREFGVSLGIYKGAHKSDDIKLYEISDPRKNQKAFIVINKDTSVESAEAMFKNTFGIRVQVKDRNGNTVSQESTLGGIRKLDKGFVDSNENINLLDEENAEENTGEEEDSKKKKKKSYFLKPKVVKHTVEDKIKEIDKLYLGFQRYERYKHMVNLLSCMEEARLAYPDSKELIEHIEDIKNKSLNISNLSPFSAATLLKYAPSCPISFLKSTVSRLNSSLRASILEISSKPSIKSDRYSPLDTIAST